MSIRDRTRKIVPNYCSTTSPENPNQDVVEALLNEVKCMYDRLVGGPAAPGVVQVKEDMSKFQDLIRCLENANADLERELSRLNNELARIWADLEEEMGRRAELECLVAELRKQINEIDQELCLVTAERDRLLDEIASLMQRHEQCQSAMADLQNERDDLLRKSLNHADGTKKQICMEEDYKKALAECCARVDELTSRIGCLTAELNRALRENDELRLERDDLERKYNCLREKYDSMKRVNDALIEKLKDEIKCLETKLAEMCEKFKKMLQDHHDEMDKILAENMRLKKLLEDERKLREDLERRLKDCERQTRKSKPPPSCAASSYPPPRFHTPLPPCPDPCKGGGCDQFKADINKLEQQKNELESSRKCLEQQVDCLSNQRDTMTRHIQSLQIEHQTLNNRPSHTHKEHEHVHFDNRGSQTQPTSNSFDQHNADIRKLTSEKTQLEHARQSLEREVCHLTIQNDETYKKLKALEEKHADLENNRNAFDKINNNNISLLAKLGEHAEIKEDLERKVAHLEMKLESKESIDESELSELRRDKLLFETEKAELASLKEKVEKEKEQLNSLTKSKTQIEAEVNRLKEAISKQVIDQGEVNKLKANYEGQIQTLQNKFDSQLEMNRQLAEINEQLGKQFKDRDLINSIRDSNEELLRKELSSVIAASKADIEELKRIIVRRNEKVTSLRRAVSLLKHKYISASQEKEELLKKVQILASSSRENVLELEEVESDTDNNNE